MDFDTVLNIIEKNELVQAIQNIQLVGSINGVSDHKKKQNT
jgi:hypothetical protein